MVAELIQRQWKESLGINVGLGNQEWHAYLSSRRIRKTIPSPPRGWIGDYIDPNTFLGMFVTGGADNQTGWSNAKYDELIADAAKEQDDQKRLQDFHDAEQILMDEMPVIPVYVLGDAEHGAALCAWILRERARHASAGPDVGSMPRPRNRFLQTEGLR